MVDLPASPTPVAGQAPAQAKGTAFGGTPAVAPTPNRGFEMAGKQKVAMALKVLQETIPLFGSASPEGQDILDCLKKLGKIAQPGDVSQQGQMNELQKRMLAQIQQGQLQKQLAQPQGQGQAQAPGAGGAPQAPPTAA